MRLLNLDLACPGIGAGLHQVPVGFDSAAHHLLNAVLVLKIGRFRVQPGDDDRRHVHCETAALQKRLRIPERYRVLVLRIERRAGGVQMRRGIDYRERRLAADDVGFVQARLRLERIDLAIENQARAGLSGSANAVGLSEWVNVLF